MDVKLMECEQYLCASHTWAGGTHSGWCQVLHATPYILHSLNIEENWALQCWLLILHKGGVTYNKVCRLWRFVAWASQSLFLVCVCGVLKPFNHVWWVTMWVKERFASCRKMNCKLEQSFTVWRSWIIYVSSSWVAIMNWALGHAANSYLKIVCCLFC